MSIDRQQLETDALNAVDAEYYYELVDTISEMDDERLEAIIAQAKGAPPKPSM